MIYRYVNTGPMGRPISIFKGKLYSIAYSKFLAVIYKKSNSTMENYYRVLLYCYIKL